VLSVAVGDVVQVDYVDALDCDGSTNAAYTATATVDCAPPVITGVGSSVVTGNSATITWSTDEPATSVVHYGPVPPGASTTSVATLVTNHAVPLTGLQECTPYSYWVESADAVGNNASDNAGGAYYGFATLKNTTPNYPSSGGPLPIPDNNTTGVTSTIAVPDDKIVQDVNVKVNINHTYDGDLAISLIPPVGAPILLSNHIGGTGENFVNTVFDDAASTPISSGVAPFTGTYIPSAPLSSANGIHSIGNWGLKVVDNAGSDTGSILNWTLTLTYPTTACGPHGTFSGHASVSDACATGGTGNANGTWEPGEQVQFKISLTNDGTTTLTGLTVTVTPTTPGVTMPDGTASYADLPPGATADSLAPHITAKLPAGLACGSTVAFNVSIQSNQGSWPGGSFTHAVGVSVPPGGVVLNEGFNAGIPATWVVNNGGVGGGAAATWTTANPGGRTFAAPLVAPVAIVDSDNAGSGASQDEQLITPVMSFVGATTVTLEFDQHYRWYNLGLAEVADVDVKSSITGNNWVNVLRQTTTSSSNPNHQTIAITAQAAGASDVQARFHYYNAQYEWWWQVDNVKVSFTAPGGCQSVTCNAPPPPPSVPDGTFGAAMTCSRAAADGSSIDLAWDVSSCTGAGYKALYGSLATLPSYALDGAACGLGTWGSATWSGVPAGDLWYVVVSSDGAGIEGSWGSGTAGPIGGTSASSLCSDTTRNNAGTCP
jgi:uncharacterized repeat protein (TIGR01451 family)